MNERSLTPRPRFPRLGKSLLDTPFDTTLERFWRRFLDWETGDGGTFAPITNVVEQPDSYLVTVELPGVRKEDVHVTLSHDVLTLHGEKRADTETEAEGFRCFEATYGAFQRAITLPDAADQDVEAELADGVLRIVVRKRKEARAKEIAVKVKK